MTNSTTHNDPMAISKPPQHNNHHSHTRRKQSLLLLNACVLLCRIHSSNARLTTMSSWLMGCQDVSRRSTQNVGQPQRRQQQRQHQLDGRLTCFNDRSCLGFVPSSAYKQKCKRSIANAPTSTNARRRPPYDEEDDEWDAYFDEDDNDDDYYQQQPRRQRRPRPIDNLGTPPLTGSSPDDTSLSIPSPFGRGDTGLRLPSSVSAALLAGVFVLGIGTGVTVDSQINTNPKDLASRDAVDKNAPNPTLCTTYGASAMAFDQRVFVSFNPFNVYVAQADVKPACVLRPANIVPILKERKLLNDNEIRGCKMNMNTWAFVGDLNDQPQLSCVYKSEDAQNEFLEDPKRGIGEDYLDDDIKMRSKESLEKGTKKMVKDTLTEGQRQKIMEMGERQAAGGGVGMF
eukprot:scaffold845_cov199-Alexandrium_tamarense.AAC.22